MSPTTPSSPATPATAGPPSDRELIDTLVPPPWSRSRRLAGLAVTAIIVVVLGALWWTGVSGPNLGPIRGYGYGALDDTVGRTDAGARRGVVELQLRLDNRGLLDVHDLTVRTAGFAGAELTQPGGPIDIPARSSRDVTLHLAIEDCSRFQAPPRAFLSYDATSNGIDAHGSRLRIPPAGDQGTIPTWTDAREPGVSSWWYELAQSVCDPEAFAAP